MGMLKARSLFLFWAPIVALLIYGAIRVPLYGFLATRYPEANELLADVCYSGAPSIRAGELDLEGAAVAIEACAEALELANTSLKARLGFSAIWSILLLLLPSIVITDRLLLRRVAA